MSNASFSHIEQVLQYCSKLPTHAKKRWDGL